MDITLLSNKITEHYTRKFPFALFSLPESETATLYLQKDDKLHITEDFSEKGIIMAPFKFKGTALCISEIHSEVSKLTFPKETFSEEHIEIAENVTDRKAHIDLVTAAKVAINRTRSGKIVVSRQKEIDVTGIDFEKLIPRLLNLYPNTFRYLWYHPSTGMWCGASPEVLVKTNGDSFSTMSLAGTHLYNPKRDAVWSDKEIQEQQIVTDSITSDLQKVTSVIKMSKTYNHRAGSLMHLRTDITGILKKGRATLGSIAKVLHPTPAVCGSPKILAKSFIEKHEPKDREFYTGFIGLANEANTSSQLFVNLRCMKIDATKATLFVGGGITSSSVPEDEWQETHNKLQTMVKVLQPLL